MSIGTPYPTRGVVEVNRDSARWAVSPAGVIGVAIALTALALIENTVAPWAPFYVVYAVAAIVIPLRLGTYAFGRFRKIGAKSWLLAVGSAVALQAVGVLLIGIIYMRVLGAAGVSESALAGPFYSVDAALGSMLQTAADRWGTDARDIRIAYLGFIVVWAGFGEEIFYRGYIHGVLARHRGFATAATVSAFFFAIRHATQLALLWPSYPWAAAGAWVVFSFVIGLFLSLVYHRTRSLYLPIVIHYMFNVIPIVGALLAPGAP